MFESNALKAVFLVFLIAVVVHFPIVSAVDISSCVLLDSADTYYRLTSDISGSNNQTCLNITASNITLDCNGNTVDGVCAGGMSTAIYSNSINTSVIDCTVRDFDYGIWFDGVDDGVIDDADIRSFGSHAIRIENSPRVVVMNSYTKSKGTSCQSGKEGLYLLGGNDYCNVSYNTFDATLYSYNVYIGSNFCRVEHIYCPSSSGYGNFNLGGNNNYVNFLNSGSSGRGLYVGGDNHTINNTYIWGNSENFQIHGNNHIFNNITMSGGTYGFYLYNTNNVTIKNSQIISGTSNYEFFFRGTSNLHIYNNYINARRDMPVRFLNGGTNYNEWNASYHEGVTNIIGGNFFGGNWWGMSNGVGFSENETLCAPIGSTGRCANSKQFQYAQSTDFLVLTYLNWTSPNITLYGPVNTTYSSLTVVVNASVDKTVDTWWYNLNDAGNVTFTPNTTVSAQEGANDIIVYVNDTVGTINSSTVYFTVSLPKGMLGMSGLQAILTDAGSGLGGFLTAVKDPTVDIILGLGIIGGIIVIFLGIGSAITGSLTSATQRKYD